MANKETPEEIRARLKAKLNGMSKEQQKGFAQSYGNNCQQKAEKKKK